MLYFKLHKNILRNHVGAESVFFAVEDDLMDFETIVVGMNKKEPWASLFHSSGERFDTSDCEQITEREYKHQYEYQNELNTL